MKCDILGQTKLIELPLFEDSRGCLSFFEFYNQIPFEIDTTRWVYRFPTDSVDMRNTVKHVCTFIVALSGSFVVLVGELETAQRFTLNHPRFGLFVPAGIGFKFIDYSIPACALIVCSKQKNDIDEQL